MIAERYHHSPAELQRFAVILRGENFLMNDARGAPAWMGFYIVRTAIATDQPTAEKLALFDLEAEIRSSPRMKDVFFEVGSLAVEEAGPLADEIDDCDSGFIFYAMD